MNEIDEEKRYILQLFESNVKDKPISLENQNKSHCGKEGHWLEDKMGIKHNSKNEPDINGYEMKTGNKVTTFIDKAPDNMFLNGEQIKKRKKDEKKSFWDMYACLKQSDEPTIGGWRINEFNYAGQKLCIDEKCNLFVIYNYLHDKREHKDNILHLNKEPHIIMRWNTETLKKSIENKFNKKGFFKCIKNNNTFNKICFGGPITYDFWIEQVKKGVIYHDGYSKVSGRSRHVFRASNKFWDELITEEY